jgi:hypothetical protein
MKQQLAAALPSWQEARARGQKYFGDFSPDPTEIVDG